MYLSCTGKKWISIDARRWSIFPKMVTYICMYIHVHICIGEKIIELNNKHQFKKNKQVKKGCAKVKEKVEILISFE